MGLSRIQKICSSLRCNHPQAWLKINLENTNELIVLYTPIVVGYTLGIGWLRLIVKLLKVGYNPCLKPETGSLLSRVLIHARIALSHPGPN